MGTEDERFCRTVLYDASKPGRGGLFGGEMPVMSVRVVKKSSLMWSGERFSESLPLASVKIT